jgi:hypothetical protein
MDVMAASITGLLGPDAETLGVEDVGAGVAAVGWEVGDSELSVLA